MYNIKILTYSDNVVVTDTATKSFQIMCNNKPNSYSAEDIKAVVIKTMDTGPIVEDMYAEIYMDDAIYIALSESPLFNDIILEKLSSIIPIDIGEFMQASMYKFNNTFVLYKRDNDEIDFNDTDEKLAAILDSTISLLNDIRQEYLARFIFAIMSFCPMYMLQVKGENKFVSVNEQGEIYFPIYTTLDKCPSEDRYEKVKFSPDEYIVMLPREDYAVALNPYSDYQLVLGTQQLKASVLSLILFRANDSI